MPRKTDNGRRPIRLASVVGARPQFIKAAAISRAVERHNASPKNRTIEDILIHTGQHYDNALSGVFFEELRLPVPRYNLGVGSGPQGLQTARMLMRLETVLRRDPPDAVLVHGDTNSTLAGALAAAKLGLPLAHAEAGLRSRNKAMPEEINRILADRLSDWLFCPTTAAVRNLSGEGLRKNVRLVGDVMYDVFLTHRKEAKGRSRILKTLDLRPRRYGLATVHRQENTDDPAKLADIILSLGRVAQSRFPVVFPLHPRTRRAMRGITSSVSAGLGLLLVDPLPYFDMLALLDGARLVLTDSGGLQKEAAFAGVPCVTLRRETEWTETVRAGRNRLAGTAPARVAAAVSRALRANRLPPLRLYGRGDAADRIVRILAREIGAH